MQMSFWFSTLLIFSLFILGIVLKKALSPNIQRLLASNLYTYLVVFIASILIITSQFNPASPVVILWTLFFNLLFDVIFYLISQVSH